MDAIALGPVVIPLSRLFLILGLVTAFLVARRWERRSGADILTPLAWAFIAGWVVARAAYVAWHWPDFSGDPLNAFYLWQDGHLPLAGLGAAFILAAHLARRRRLPRIALHAPIAAGAGVWLGLTLIAGALSAQHELPEVALLDLDERPASLQAWRGAPIVVNLWATWCPPCRREMPVLRQAQLQHPDIHFVFVNQGESAHTVTTYLRDEGLEIENVLRDPHGALARHFSALAMPTTLFFDAEGRLADSHLGEVSAARLRQYLEALE